MSSHQRVWIALLAVYLIWGSTYLAIRVAVQTVPPFLMGGVRFIIAGGLMYAVLRLRGAAKPTRRHWMAATVIGGLLILGGNGGIVWAEQYIPSGLAALLVASEPLWVVVVDWIRPRGSRPLAAEVFGLLLGFAGVAWLISPAQLVGGSVEVHPVGALVVVVAALSWAIGSVYSRHTPSPESQFLATAMKMLCGGTLLLLLGASTGELGRFATATITPASMVAWAYLIVFGSWIGFVAYIWLLKNTTLARASTYAYVNPIVAVVLGWLILDEPLTLRVVAAAGVIVGSVVIITLARKPVKTITAEHAAA
jgi:drug/metabolite transporter (DMT)-like permease